MIEISEERVVPLSKGLTFKLITDIEYIKRNAPDGFKVSHSSSNPFGFNRTIYIKRHKDNRAILVKVSESKPPDLLQLVASTEDHKIKALVDSNLREIDEKTLLSVNIQLSLGLRSLPGFIKSIIRFFGRRSVNKELDKLVARAKTYA